ncbi:hypothetical protein [Streptomyces sp. RerS4]|uniref:hypothetical protein n=1 Tax=Streptomyces sp. RerS4 TaxID=2942449 RepID=UPI00201C1ADE|nr:hypothetical protein [Streptomyces sp. RerS4]UQW99190.1 hypothetical protein M4D82_00520 [Streptomyces sp. RerS4]
MPGPELPRRSPAGASARQPGSEPSSRIPWDAFAASADDSATYGQPSAALIARARRGWQQLGSLHARTGQDGIQ